MTGRLYKRLVTKEEVAVGRPYASHSSRKYAGYFEISATAKEGHAPEEVEQMILEEVEKLREGEITDYELEKVKNQVMASSVQRLRSNIGLMFQLGIYDTWYTWNYLNESPERMLKVTADDVHRMVQAYLDAKARTVAIYRTKEGAQTEEDPELAEVLANVPADSREQMKAAIKRIKEGTDLAKLQQSIPMMEQMMSSDQVPEDQKAVMSYMVKTMKARVVELEAANKETE